MWHFSLSLSLLILNCSLPNSEKCKNLKALWTIKSKEKEKLTYVTAPNRKQIKKLFTLRLRNRKKHKYEKERERCACKYRNIVVEGTTEKNEQNGNQTRIWKSQFRRVYAIKASHFQMFLCRSKTNTRLFNG